MTRVSVIVPLFNKERTIARTLRSILNQTHSDLEVIVVDDGSTDDSLRLVSAHLDDRIRVVQQANAGPGAARNAGVAIATSDIVAFLDADDEWRPTFLESAVRDLEAAGQSHAAVTYCYATPASCSTAVMWKARGIAEGSMRLAPDTPPMRAVHMLAFMSPCTTVAWRTVVTQYGGFYAREKCRYAEDAYLWLKVLLNERVIFRLDAQVVVHAEDAELSNTRHAGRPVEPFLNDAAELEAVCPAPLRLLLRQILAIRANKTACVIAYWGDWRRARNLRRKFQADSPLTSMYTWLAPICASPIGAVAGRTLRLMRGASGA